MDRQLFLACFLIANLAVVSAQAEGQASDRRLGADVAGLLAYAREHNPQLAASDFEADAARQRGLSAGSLPDPVLRVELMDVTNQGTRPVQLSPSQVGSTRYLLMQSVPWFGKRDLKREAAEARVAQAGGEAASIWADLSGQIKTTFANYYFLAGSERLLRQELEFAKAQEKIARERYARGLGKQQEAVRAQMEQTTLQSELIRLQNEVHHQHVRLNALLSRPSDAELDEPARLRPLPPPEKLDPAGISERLRTANPQLRIADAQSDEATKNRELAYAGRYPDFTLGVAPTQRGSSVKSWDLMVELNIPLQQGTRRSQEHEADAALAAAEARNRALQDRLQAMMTEALSGLEAARRTERLTAEGLLPQAELGYRSALAAYETGGLEFGMLLDARRQVLRVKRQLLQAQFEGQSRLAEIESLLGEEL